MLNTENKQTIGGSQTPTSSMMELFVMIKYQEAITHWQNNSSLDDVGIDDLPLNAIIFSFHDNLVSMIKLEAWRRTLEAKTRGLNYFTYWYPLSFSQFKEYNLLLPLVVGIGATWGNSKIQKVLYSEKISKPIKYFSESTKYFND